MAARAKNRQYEISASNMFDVYTGPSIKNRVVRQLRFREIITVFKEQYGWFCINEEGTEWVLDQDRKYFVPYKGKELFTEDGRIIHSAKKS